MFIIRVKIKQIIEITERTSTKNIIILIELKSHSKCLNRIKIINIMPTKIKNTNN